MLYAIYYKINQLEKFQDFICALIKHIRVLPEIIEFISPSSREKDRCAARMQCPCIDMPQLKILTLDRLNPRDHACKFPLESKETFQPVSTGVLERKLSFPK